jgi:Methyltransferase domain
MTRFKPLLSEIASKYHCDKGLFGPSENWNGNNYVDVYEAYLRDRADQPLQILEIGIGVAGPSWDAKIAQGQNREGGASLKMWYEFLPNSKIYALDINPATHLDNDRVKTAVVDQGSREQLESFRASMGESKFDLIIDDGSHRGDHQQITLELLWPLLKSGGMYVIEDLNDRGFGERTSGRHTSDVISTRKLLLNLSRTGEISSPNAFKDTAFVDEISDIRFHCPVPLQTAKDVVVESIRQVLGKAKRGVMRSRFAGDSFKIVALRKR